MTTGATMTLPSSLTVYTNKPISAAGVSNPLPTDGYEVVWLAAKDYARLAFANDVQSGRATLS